MKVYAVVSGPDGRVVGIFKLKDNANDYARRMNNTVDAKVNRSNRHDVIEYTLVEYMTSDEIKNSGIDPKGYNYYEVVMKPGGYVISIDKRQKRPNHESSFKDGGKMGPIFVAYVVATDEDHAVRYAEQLRAAHAGKAKWCNA